jgi:hypothetical protein
MAKGFADGGLAGAITPMQQQPMQYEQYATGLQHPSTLPENQIKPGGVGGGLTYNTAEGNIATFDPAKQMFVGADGQPYTGTIQLEGGPSYSVTGGVNPAYTGVNAYDPTTGLPSLPAGSDIDTYMQGEGKVPDFMQGQIKSIIEGGNIPEDPSKYSITGGPGNWTITFDNGASFTSPNLNPASAENDAKMAAASLSGYKGTTNDALYQSQLEEYKQAQRAKAEQAAATPVYETVQAAQTQITTSNNIISNYMNQLAGMGATDPQRKVLEDLIAEEQVKLNQANAGLQQAQQRAAQERSTARLQAASEFEADPSSKVKVADVATMSQAQKEAGMIAEGTGQAGAVTDAALTQAIAAEDVVAPEAKAAVTYDATQASESVKNTVDTLVAATGKPSDEALKEGATMQPDELASLGLTVDQIAEATQVQAPEARTMQAGEEVSAAVDFERAKAETNFTAATGVPSTEATVQGQLTQLLSQFEGGETPAWAAGAMRAATATLAARGLAASSMAGQAVVQAAMESALPIAQQDAATRAQFEQQNLSNRQQAAMFAAEQRSKFLGMEFDQEFQTRVQNAAKISDIANMNFTAEQQIALENARLAQTVDITNLNARNAKIMADAAAMSQVDITNLNNRQQAAIQQATAFLQMDMANLSNEQQTAMFKSQAIVNSLLSDTAAENAAKQFNATSENQVNQFYDSLTAQVQQFNVDQSNAMERFNAGEANALAEFNAAQQARREEFNAQNALIVEQANAKWAQDIALTETAAINEANRDAARAENDMTMAAYESQIQLERDKMSYAFQTANNNADRATTVAVETMRTEASANAAAAQKSSSFASAAGSVISAIIMG